MNSNISSDGALIDSMISSDTAFSGGYLVVTFAELHTLRVQTS